jgi:hypothetical protein
VKGEFLEVEDETAQRRWHPGLLPDATAQVEFFPDGTSCGATQVQRGSEKRADGAGGTDST